MKIVRKLVIAFALMVVCNFVFGQTQMSEPSQEPLVPYMLFRTTNIWTFIQLDTVTGKMWQIQYDVSGDSRGAVVLSSQNLASEKEKIPGRFTLYPTSNMYNFILLNQIDGGSWQVQWSSEAKNRFVIPISN